MNEKGGGELMGDVESKVEAIEGSRNDVLWREIILGIGITLGGKQQGGDRRGHCHTKPY